jgi:hypothetical protein
MDPTDPIRRVSVVSTGIGSRRRLREATAMINTMRQRDPGLVILPAHDPAAASRLAQATGQVPTLATV